jgi:hypothetical protein
MPREYILQPFRQPVHLRIDYAKELNEQQHAAVTAPPGPALIIAGAGSGKTRTLTYRVAYLLEQGIPPESVLLLTFTNKAAKEMMLRVGQLVGGELPGLWGGTFHAIGARILRRNAQALGYEPDFSILDREDSKDLLRACLADMKIDTKSEHFPKPDVLGDIFSLSLSRRSSRSNSIIFSQWRRKSPRRTKATRRGKKAPTRWISTTCSRCGCACSRNILTCSSNNSAASSSCWSMNTRTPTKSRERCSISSQRSTTTSWLSAMILKASIPGAAHIS